MYTRKLLFLSLSFFYSSLRVTSRKIRSMIFECLSCYFFLRFTVPIKATLLRLHSLFSKSFRLVSTREQQTVENLNDRFRPRIVSLYRFFPRTIAVVRSYRNIAKNKPRWFQISRCARLDFFLLQAQTFHKYNRESRNEIDEQSGI